ncbi:unnamed protein product [Prunus brigantina]
MAHIGPSNEKQKAPQLYMCKVKDLLIVESTNMLGNDHIKAMMSTRTTRGVCLVKFAGGYRWPFWCLVTCDHASCYLPRTRYDICTVPEVPRGHLPDAAVIGLAS